MKKYLLAFILMGLGINISYSQNFGSSTPEDFLKMGRYLSKGSGQWMAPNPNFDPNNPRSHESLGLWFDFKLNEKMIELSIVMYIRDTAHIISSGMWIWHPGEQRIKYYDIKIGGTFMDGETYFTEENIFVTRSFTYTPNGKIHFALGDNVMLSEDEHETTSNIYENANWREQASYVWKRVAEKEGYSAVKNY